MLLVAYCMTAARCRDQIEEIEEIDFDRLAFLLDLPRAPYSVIVAGPDWPLQGP